MRLFRHRPAHQIVAATDRHNQLVYQCSICQRRFHSAQAAVEGKEYCPGKRCYVERTFDEIPAWLLPESEIKATRRTLRKHQEVIAYKHYELIGSLVGPRPIEYIPLYDIRECVALNDAVPLPAFD